MAENSKVSITISTIKLLGPIAKHSPVEEAQQGGPEHPLHVLCMDNAQEESQANGDGCRAKGCSVAQTIPMRSQGTTEPCGGGSAGCATSVHNCSVSTRDRSQGKGLQGTTLPCGATAQKNFVRKVNDGILRAMGHPM